MSQVFTTPTESREMATPPLTYRLTDLIEDGSDEVNNTSVVTESVGRALVFQNLTVLSHEVETRKSGNMREVMPLA